MTAAARVTVEELNARVAAVRAEMGAAGLACVCVTGPEDIYYLTGLNHQGYFAFTMLVLPLTGMPVIVARKMEAITLSVQLPWCLHYGYQDHEDPAAVAVAAIGAVLPAATAAGVRREQGRHVVADQNLGTGERRAARRPPGRTPRS